jgi:hypothetical protein
MTYSPLAIRNPAKNNSLASGTKLFATTVVMPCQCMENRKVWIIKKAASSLLGENRSLENFRPIATVEVAARKARIGGA